MASTTDQGDWTQERPALFRGIAATIDTDFAVHPADVYALGGEFDQTFAATTASGCRYVVKVYRAEDLDGVRWQHRLLDRLAGSVPVAAVCRTRTGDDVARLADGRYLGLYSWIDGTLLAELPSHSRDLLADWGATAARIVMVLDGAHTIGTVPPTHTWDLLAAPHALTVALPSIQDGRHREIVEQARALFADVVAPIADDLPKGVVHQDLNDFNVLADPAGERIAGVIDFADALYTARVCEPAIAGAYAMLRKDDPVAALAEVVAGFTRILPLTDAELSVIFPLARIRLAVNAATWTARRDGPARAYGQARSQHTWRALQQLSGVPLDSAQAQIRAAAVGTDTAKGARP